MKPVAIVIPWFGRDLKGGAELQAWQIAARLAARGRAVEVLTTCCRSAQDDWGDNHLPAGTSREPEGFTVRRFPVQRRDPEAAGPVLRRLWAAPPSALKPGVSPVSDADAATFSRLIHSPRLLRHLRWRADRYGAFLFIPYLYGPTLAGLPLVASKAWLQPCLHDEAYAYLLPVAAVFHQARGILFNSEGELELALRLFGPGIFPKSAVVGEGVEVPEATAPCSAPPGRFPFGDAPYVLCLGRKGPGKNSPLLLGAFRRFKAAQPGARLKLVFAGTGPVELDGLQGEAFDLGVVSEADKLALLDGCRALFQPSENESFSRVIMEAWRRGRPVAAHRRCLATATSVRRCGGGWLADSEGEWTALLAAVESAPAGELAAKGAAGRACAREAGDWDRAIARCEAAMLGGTASLPAGHAARIARRPTAVHQVLPAIVPGDAISNQARWIRETLRQSGMTSEILALHVDPAIAGECRRFSPGCIGASDAVLYHHSIGSELIPHVAAHRGPKCLLYHNITPAEFFLPSHPQVAALLRQGREELRLLAKSFPVSAGGSAYNARELCDAGFADPGVLPYVVDPARWDEPADARLMAQLQAGHTNLLFVGRLAPNKRQDDLIRAFRAYLDLDPNAVLHLVGGAIPDDPYLACLAGTLFAQGLGKRVNFANHVTEPQLAAYYRTARLFWSMSEHEGFGVPLIEAMWFDVPVLAFKSSAIPETLQDAGLMFTAKCRPYETAALARLLTRDDDLREKVIAAQRQRRACFLPSAVKPELFALLDRWLGSRPAA